MEGALTISKNIPVRKSMQYDELRQLGIQHIQSLAGKLWTDFNTHDPGVTMLEIVSYAITELGYRVNYEMMDILAQDPDDSSRKDIQNFYTACEILPNCALTFNDYRKLMMDVEVIEEITTTEGEETTVEKIYAGVKNAWINCVENDGEKEIFIDRKNTQLSLKPIPNAIEQESYFVKTLYDVLLEFDKNDKYGDLNENKLTDIFTPTLAELNGETDLLGIGFITSIEFPRWDETDVNWEDVNAILAKIKPGHINISVIGNTNDFPWTINVNDPTNITVETEGDPDLTVLATAFEARIHEMGLLYKDKVKKNEEIICAVKARLHANRNLCDDFFRFHALKIEEIILCTDIELAADADVEKVEAEILLAISDFLAPKVYFYTLEEMQNKCRNAQRYTIASVNKNRRIFTISDELLEDINKDDVITVEGIPAAGEYTVKCIAPNKELAGQTDIEVLEEILTENIEPTAALFKGIIEADTCLTVDQIFEGPKLKHGFIDENELVKADRKKFIHVSDLIRIIMDIDDVIAVKNIQIANRPLDNDTNIPSRSVKWCLELAMQDNYVPRLNIKDSILTFFKGQLPFVGKKEETFRRLDELEKNQRPQKIRYPQLDIPVPLGEYKDLESYTSIQEHFPLFYGVGHEGIPGLSALNNEQRKARESSVKQHKAYLLFLDQFLANFMSQLSHVKDLFSMNGDKNKFGEYEISKSYFAQPLFDVIPNADPLYRNKVTHDLALQEMIESTDVFEPRRNKFLDHLLGRFAETFSDYALLTYKVSGAKAPVELIEDKLQFLKKYPKLSASRGKGMNYKAPCDVWHIDNVSGLELRASLLLGIEEKSASELVFSPNFIIQENSGIYTFEIKDQGGTSLLKNSSDFDSEIAIKTTLESVITNGTCKDNYEIITDRSGDFSIQLICGGKVIAESVHAYNSLAALQSDLDEIIKTLAKEFSSNPESNRKNLACPLDKYFKTYNVQAKSATDTDPASISFQYDVFETTEATTRMFSGTFERESKENPSEEEKEIFVQKHLWEILTLACDRKQYVFNTMAGDAGNFRFYLCDRFGNEETIGKSEEVNFNDKLKNELENLNNIPSFSWEEWVTVSATNASGMAHTTTFSTVQAAEELVSLTLDGSLPTALQNLPFSEMQLSFRNAFEILSVNFDDRFLDLDVDINDISSFLLPQDKINILELDLTTIAVSFTILSFEDTGTSTKVYVKESIPDLTDYDLIAPEDAVPTQSYSDKLATYQKEYQIKNINGNIITFYGKEEEKALEHFIDWLKSKFFSHEGMHLIEHHLLRPRICDLFIGEAFGTSADYGSFEYSTDYPLFNTIPTENKIVILNNVAADFMRNDSIVIEGTKNDGTYTIKSVMFNGETTVLEFNESFPDNDSETTTGLLRLTKTVSINRIIPGENKVKINAANNIPPGTIATIKDSKNKILDGAYEVEETTFDSKRRTVCLIGLETTISDNLLPIHLDQDCENCKITDPYSCVATVILPYWPGRFQNMDVRNFIEKTLRTEAPAHAFLNICWVNCEDMHSFESAYRNWLLAISKKVPDPLEQNKSLNALLKALSATRTVYPKGTLHSCDDDDTFNGSIVLNHSALGIIE